MEVKLFRRLDLAVIFFLFRGFGWLFLLNFFKFHFLSFFDFPEEIVFGSGLGVFEEGNTYFSIWEEGHISTLNKLDKLLLFFGYSTWVVQEVMVGLLLLFLTLYNLYLLWLLLFGLFRLLDLHRRLNLVQ